MARRLRAQATTDGDSRRAELRATVQLALPLVATQLGQIAIHTTDVVMIGWLGPQSLAAGIRGHQVYFVSWLFGLGILTVIAPLVAQAMGAKCCAPQLLTGLVTAGLQPAIRLSRLENPMLNGEIEY